MAVDTEVRQLLDMLEQLGTPSLAGSTPDDARAQFRMLTVDARDPDSVVPVAEVEELTVPGGGKERPARLYRPQVDTDGPLPLLVLFHGGGFVIGDLDTHDGQARRLCRDLGALVLSVDYRLAPEHPFPAALQDGLAATRWAAEHARELGGDPTRLAVGGDSAGGNLAAAVAQGCRDAGGPALAAQLLIYPVVDLTDPDGEVHHSRRENGEGYLLTQDDMRWFEACYLDDEDHADPRASPLHGELAGLPPAVVVTAEYDPLRDEGDAYARALARAGVPVEHRRHPRLIHGFFGMTAVSAACDRAVAETCEALSRLWSPARA